MSSKKSKTKKTAEAAKTAPELPAKLRKKIDIDSANDSTETKLKIKPKSAEDVDEPETQDEPETPTELDKADESDKPGSAASDGPLPQVDVTALMEQSVNLDDTQIDEAVKDIVAHEGDVMLAVADATTATRNQEATEVSTQKNKRGAFATIFWFIIFVLAIVCIVFFWLLLSGGNLPANLQNL